MEQGQEQAAPQETQPQPQQVRIGFGAALDRYDPEWQQTWSQQQIDQARHFYSSGMRDINIFLQNAINNLNEGLGALNSLLNQPQASDRIPSPPAGDTAAAQPALKEPMQPLKEVKPAGKKAKSKR